MNDRVKKYYKNNYLFTGHRMVLPDAGEKFQHCCGQCKYFVEVIGQQETRRVCLAEVRAFSSGRKRVPENIEIMDLMLLLGQEALHKLLGKGGFDQMACGTFSQRI